MKVKASAPAPSSITRFGFEVHLVWLYSTDRFERSKGISPNGPATPCFVRGNLLLPALSAVGDTVESTRDSPRQNTSESNPVDLWSRGAVLGIGTNLEIYSQIVPLTACLVWESMYG